jgi:hypothetical protein
VEVERGVYENQALEDLCAKCGAAVRSFPLQTKEEIIEMAKDRMFRAQLVLLGEVSCGERPKGFRPGIVRIRRSLGLKFYSTVAVVDIGEFLIHMKMPVSFDLNKAPKLQTVEFVDEECENRVGVIVKPDSLPVGVSFRLAEMYNTSESEIMELMMTDQEHIRDGQPMDPLVSGTFCLRLLPDESQISLPLDRAGLGIGHRVQIFLLIHTMVNFMRVI